MKKQTKLTLIALLVVLTLTCVVGLVACDQKGAEEAIKMYILPQAETLVSADFTLPKAIGADNSVQVKWTSDNTAAIAIEDAGEAYTAKVTIQDQITDVKLTISAGKHSKDFTVRVDGFSVYTFSDHFPFAQKNGAVKKDFDLETSYTYQGKTATITWSIDSQYEQYIQLNAEKTKVIVTQPEDITPVAINAEFSYNNESAPVTYNFSVVPPFEHRQEIARMYSVADYPVEISGYVVHIYENSESYNNATFYVIDDDFCSGYYMFRCTDATTDQHLNKQKLTEGCHVTISGATAKDYNGLWENNSNGTFVVDDDKTPINPRDYIYPLDTDLLSGVQSCIWHESTLVSLSGWKLAEKYTKPTGSDSNMFKLEKNGLQITVRISKYINRTDAELAELLAVYDQFEVGQYVNVVGILGNFNAFQIQPILASDITKADAEVANTDGAKVKAAIAAVDAKVKEHFSTTIVADTTVSDMPIEVDGVDVSYRLAGDGLQDITVTVDGGKIEVKPNASYKNYDIEVTYSIGDYKGYSFFKLPNQKLDNQGIVDTVKAAIESKTLPEVKATGDVDLPSVDAMGAVISWSIENKPDWVTIDDSKITVNALPTESTTLTVVATISLNGKEATAKLTLSVSAAATEVFQAIEAPAEGKYVFSMMKKGTRYYASSLELDSGDEGYIQTSDDPSKAVQLELVKHGDSGWYIKMGEKYLEINPYENPNSGKTSYKLKLVAQPTADWKWRETEKIFAQSATEVTGDNPATNDFYIGTYDDSSFTTMSPSNVSYIEGDKAANLDVSQHPARFGSILPGSGSQGGGGSQGGTTPEPTDPNVINITVDTLTFGKGYNTEEETGELNGVTFGWIGVMHNTYEGATQNSIQGRSDRNSAFYTKTALPNALKTIRLHMAGTNGYSNEHVFYATFATSFEGLSASDVATVTMDTVEGVTEYTITAPEGNWTFVKLTWGDAHASYWKSIELVLDGAGSGTTSGGSQGSTEPGGTTPGGTTPGGTTPGGSQSGGQNVPLTSPVTIKSNQTATTNLTGTDDKEKFDFSSGKDLFTIVGTKVSGNNNVGLNKDGTIRLYKNGSATLTISIANGYVIDSITIKYQTRNTYGDNMVQPTVMVGDDSITATGAATTIDEYNSSLTWNINAQSFVITDTDSADQVRIVEIVVTCHKAA